MFPKNQITLSEHADFHLPLTLEQGVVLANHLDEFNIYPSGEILHPLPPLLRLGVLATIMHEQISLSPDRLQQFYEECRDLGLT